MNTSGEILGRFYDAVKRRDIPGARQYLDDKLLFIGLFEAYRSADDLPAAVKDAVSAKHGDVKITRAEKTTRGDAVTYELRLAADKTRWGMELDPSGKVLKDSKPHAKNEKSVNEKSED